ncbi:hypothetical protein GCM10027026_39630 [Myroides odoratimimus subsp. xuanwuensis]
MRHHLENAVDPDWAHPEFQSTALVASILAGHRDVAHLLLDHGADPLLVSTLEGQTPVEAAREARLADVEERLVSLGAVAPAPAPPHPLRGRTWLPRLRAARR